MKKMQFALAAAVVIMLGSAGSVFAQGALQATPFEWDPDNLCDVTAAWQDGEIVLAKNCPTATNAAAGVDLITPLEGGPVSALTSLSFDYENGGHCGAGAPRFNVVVDGAYYFLGCAAGEQTDLGNGWTRVTFDAADLAAAGVPATGTLDDLMIIFDEGIDTPAGGTIGTPGRVVIDNIAVNGVRAGDAARPTTKDQCKNGGWMTFQDPSFKNQGQCVSAVTSQRGGKK